MELDQGLRTASALPARQANHERHLEQLAVQPVAALEELAMVGQGMPVVGEQHDHLVIIVPLILEGPEKVTQAVVNKGHLAGVEALYVLDLHGRGPLRRHPAHRQDQARAIVLGVGVRVEIGRRVPRLVWIKEVDPDKDALVITIE